MGRVMQLSVVFACLTVPACHHAVIDTGRTPSAQVIHKTFASGWIFGLVPPSTVSAAAQCPNGVARVETQLSFVNQLVTYLTLGIYSPMEIKVTCAASGSAMNELPEPDIRVSEDSDVRDAFRHAADIAVEEGRDVYVQF